MEENVKKLTIKDILIRLILIVIFVFLLIWLFPMPDIKPLNNQIFMQNVNTMKEVAKTYYTVERLPKDLNGRVKMTLEEMIDKKLAFDLMDSKGKYCDKKESYIEITKLENEYVIKVNLSCSDKEDYLIEHYGCYDICSEKCNVPATTTTKSPLTTNKKITTGTNKNEVFEYLHQRTLYKEVFDKYICNINGYNLVGNKCIKNDSETITVAAKEKTETKTRVDKVFAVVRIEYENKTVDANATTKTETITTYSCPAGTVEIAGTNKCSKPTTETVNKVCPSGYTSISTTQCSKPSTETVNKVCPSGYASISSTQCSKPSTTTVNKVCPSGYASISTTQCSKSTVVSYVNKEFYWKYVGTVDLNNKVVEGQNYNGVMYKNGRPYVTYECPSCYTPTMKYRYDKYVWTAKTCPSGYTSVSATKCAKYGTVTANKVCPTGTTSISSTQCSKPTTITTSKVCPAGAASISTTQCSKPTTTTANKVCPTGTLSISPTQCSKPSTTQVDKIANTVTITKTVYECPIGTTPTSDEKLCTAREAKVIYICPTGYAQSANKLTCSKTIVEIIKTKYCEDSTFTLSNDKCIKTVNTSDTKDAETVNKIETYTEYKWSDKIYLEGWTYTNNRRIK